MHKHWIIILGQQNLLNINIYVFNYHFFHVSLLILTSLSKQLGYNAYREFDSRKFNEKGNIYLLPSNTVS